MSDGFLGRWSRRKLTQDPSSAPPELVAPTVPVRPDGAGKVPGHGAAPQPLSPGQPVAPSTSAAAPTTEPAPLPTLEDVKGLVSSSDFQPFMARGVAPDVRNAAMKKLFPDPHYNVMDGLDIYIGDYSKPDPLPAAMMRALASAHALGLGPEEPPPAAATPEAAAYAGPGTEGDEASDLAQPEPVPSQAATATESTPDALPTQPSDAETAGVTRREHLTPVVADLRDDHAYTDLQLQPDDAARRESAEPGAG